MVLDMWLDLCQTPNTWHGSWHLETKSHSSMVFSFTTTEDRNKFIGYGPIWVFNQCCTIMTYEDCPHIFACHNCGSFSHKMCDAPACLKCGGKDHMTNAHPIDLPLRCINCRKDHVSNYVNCNRRRWLLGLNPLPDASEAQTTSKKSSKNTGKKTVAKPKSVALKEKTAANHVIGLDGNQLLEAINKDTEDTPRKLWVSSALHEKTQEQLNWSSQRLHEKANAKHNAQVETLMVGMEGIVAAHSQDYPALWRETILNYAPLSPYAPSISTTQQMRCMLLPITLQTQNMNTTLYWYRNHGGTGT